MWLAGLYCWAFALHRCFIAANKMKDIQYGMLLFALFCSFSQSLFSIFAIFVCFFFYLFWRPMQWVCIAIVLSLRREKCAVIYGGVTFVTWMLHIDKIANNHLCQFCLLCAYLPIYLSTGYHKWFPWCSINLLESVLVRFALYYRSCWSNQHWMHRNSYKRLRLLLHCWSAYIWCDLTREKPIFSFGISWRFTLSFPFNRISFSLNVCCVCTCKHWDGKAHHQTQCSEFYCWALFFLCQQIRVLTIFDGTINK